MMVPTPSRVATVNSTIGAYASNPIQIVMITRNSVINLNDATMKRLAKEPGQLLISAKMRPESRLLKLSRFCEKWYDHITPDKRCATEKENRVWINVRAKPTKAFKTKTITRPRDIRMRKSFSD